MDYWVNLYVLNKWNQQILADIKTTMRTLQLVSNVENVQVKWIEV